LPDIEGNKPRSQRFKRYPVRIFHIDIAGVQTAEGKLFLHAAFDRTSKFAVTQLIEKAHRKTALGVAGASPPRPALWDPHDPVR